MEEHINHDKVLEYIRDKMEPVPMDSIVEQFANGNTDDISLKLQLGHILRAALKSGQLQKCNNYYYSSSMDEDLKDLLDLNALSEKPDDDVGDSISFSSCESNEIPEAENKIEQMETSTSNEESKTSASDEFNMGDAQKEKQQ